MVDDEDYEMLNNYKWHAHISRRVVYVDHTTKHDSTGKQFTIKMHSLILGMNKGEIVDHIDGNGLNNCKNNLRVVTNRQNCANHHNRKHIGRFPGITWEKRRNHWVAQATINKKHVHIGSYPTEELAHQAYLERVNPIEQKILEGNLCTKQT